MGEFSAKVYMKPGGDELVVGSGGAVTVEDGGTVKIGAVISLSVVGGNLVIAGLPTTDPGIAGALWSDEGVLTLGTGA